MGEYFLNEVKNCATKQWSWQISPGCSGYAVAGQVLKWSNGIWTENGLRVCLKFLVSLLLLKKYQSYY